MNTSTRLREKLSYANVMATIAVFLAFGGGAYAVQGRNTIDSADLKRGAVRSSDIRKGGVRSVDIKNNNGVKGVDVKETTLTQVPSARRADEATNADRLDNLSSTDFLRANAAAGGDLSGEYPDPLLAAGSVESAEVEDGSLLGDDIGRQSGNHTYDAPLVGASSCIEDSENLGVPEDMRDDAFVVTPDETWPSLALTTENSQNVGSVRFIVCNPFEGVDIDPPPTTVHWVALDVG